MDKRPPTLSRQTSGRSSRSVSPVTTVLNVDQLSQWAEARKAANSPHFGAMAPPVAFPPAPYPMYNAMGMMPFYPMMPVAMAMQQAAAAAAAAAVGQRLGGQHHNQQQPARRRPQRTRRRRHRRRRKRHDDDDRSASSGSSARSLSDDEHRSDRTRRHQHHHRSHAHKGGNRGRDNRATQRGGKTQRTRPRDTSPSAPKPRKRVRTRAPEVSGPAPTPPSPVYGSSSQSKTREVASSSSAAAAAAAAPAPSSSSSSSSSSQQQENTSGVNRKSDRQKDASRVPQQDAKSDDVEMVAAPKLRRQSSRRTNKTSKQQGRKMARGARTQASTDKAHRNRNSQQQQRVQQQQAQPQQKQQPQQQQQQQQQKRADQKQAPQDKRNLDPPTLHRSTSVNSKGKRRRAKGKTNKPIKSSKDPAAPKSRGKRKRKSQEDDLRPRCPHNTSTFLMKIPGIAGFEEMSESTTAPPPAAAGSWGRGGIQDLAGLPDDESTAAGMETPQRTSSHLEQPAPSPNFSMAGWDREDTSSHRGDDPIDRGNTTPRSVSVR